MQSLITKQPFIMKKQYSLLVLSLLLMACGSDKKKSVSDIIENGNLEELRIKRAELVSDSDVLLNDIASIDKAIAELDTVHKLALITTFKVKDTLFNHYLELQATVQTKENILLNAEYGGVLQQIYVTKGQQVRQGQLLAKIDDGGLSQQLAQLQIQADLSKTTYERQAKLWSQKIGSEMQYLQAKSNFEGQQKAVVQLQQQLAKTTLTAPFSGTIDDIIIERGNVVAPGMAIMRLVNLRNMYLEADVPESYIANVRKGTEALVDIPTLPETLVTTINQVGNYINPNNRSFKIEVLLSNKEGLIKPNLTAKVKIKDYSNPNAMLIPLSVISENADGEQYVYLAKDNGENGHALATRVIIETGKAQGDFIEVVNGIKVGDAIIYEGARTVKEGQKVSVLN